MGTLENAVGNDTTYEDVVFCIDNSNGREVWRFSFITDPAPHLGPRSTPVLDGDRLYGINWAGIFFCLDSKNGGLIWKRDVLADSLTDSHQWGIVGSPVIHKNLVLLNIAKNGVAFDKKTGDVVWRSEFAVNGLATPTLMKWQGEDLAVMVGVDSLYVLESETGKVKWTYPWHSFTDPVVFGNRLYLTGNLLRGAVYRSVLLDIGQDSLRVVSGSKKLLANNFSTCVVIDEYAYGFDDIRRKGPFRCIHVESSELLWSVDLDIYGAHIAADQKLIILKGNGELVIAKASPEGFHVISSAKVLHHKGFEEYPEMRRNWCWTVPVISRGKIYVRNTYGDFVCVDVS